MLRRCGLLLSAVAWNAGCGSSGAATVAPAAAAGTAGLGTAVDTARVAVPGLGAVTAVSPTPTAVALRPLAACRSQSRIFLGA